MTFDSPCMIIVKFRRKDDQFNKFYFYKYLYKIYIFFFKIIGTGWAKKVDFCDFLGSENVLF